MVSTGDVAGASGCVSDTTVSSVRLAGASDMIGPVRVDLTVSKHLSGAVGVKLWGRYKKLKFQFFGDSEGEGTRSSIA